MKDSNWDGVERRFSNRDHDTLVELVQILTAHVKNFEDHREAFKIHLLKDDTNFEKINKNMYMFNGGLVVLNAFIAIFLAWKFH